MSYLQPEQFYDMLNQTYGVARDAKFGRGFREIDRAFYAEVLDALLVCKNLCRTAIDENDPRKVDALYNALFMLFKRRKTHKFGVNIRTDDKNTIDVLFSKLNVLLGIHHLYFLSITNKGK